MVRGPFSGVPRAARHRGSAACSPVPAKVSIMPRRQVDRADAMVADVADQQQPAAGVHRDAVRLAQLCLGCGTAVAGNPGAPVPATVEMIAGLRIDLANHVVVAFGDVEVAGGVELDLVRHVQRRFAGGRAVAGVASDAVARDRRGPVRGEIEPADPLIVEIAEIQRSVRPDRPGRRDC